MRGYSILNDVSKQEILKVVEQTGSVEEAAKVLDISKNSIYRLTTPEERRGLVRRRTRIPSLMHPEKEETPACLKVEAAPINLAGAYGKYTIEEDRTYITVSGEAGGYCLVGSIPLDQLSTFIKELQAIERNIGNAQPKLEVW